MISKDISKMIGETMKAHDKVRLSTLRLLSSSFNYERINLQHELTEEEEQIIVAREAKKRRESIEVYKKAGREELAEKEQKELEILEEFLPKQMDDTELEKIVQETISQVGASNMTDMGKVIGAVMGKVKGQADGGRVSAIVKSKLQA